MFIIFIIVSISVGLVGNEYGIHNNRIHMNQVRDTTRLSDYKKIENIILGNKNIIFNTLLDIENKSNNGYKISDPTTCYYYNFDGKDYIFALKFQSEKFIHKFGEIFIYKSNEDEKLSNNQYVEINTVVNNKCN